jgi:nitric oxide reductase activation protein
MSDVTFRTAETPAPQPTATHADPQPTQQRAKSDNADAPPSLYQELEKKPYAVKYLGIDLYHDDDTFKDVPNQAKALDDYVLKQIKARGLKDDAASYKEVVDAIYKQIGRSANEDPLKSLKRLSIAAGAIARLESAKLPPVLSAKSLSPTEFEEVQP